MILKQATQLARRRRAHAGFTLIEILLVIVIILLLAGALVVFVLPQQKGAEEKHHPVVCFSDCQCARYLSPELGALSVRARGRIGCVAQETGGLENERMGEKWQGPYLKPGTILDDPWGNKIRYELNDRSGDNEKTGGLPYKLFSVGPDGQPDTDDDIKHAADDKDANNSKGAP